MKATLALALFVISVFVSGISCVNGQATPGDKDADLPKVFDHARYVYVESSNGERSERALFSEDRKAIADVEKQIRAWGRYSTATKRSEADLVFTVHKGRSPESSTVPVIVSGPQRPGSKNPIPRDPTSDDPAAGGDRGAGVDADGGSPDDQLSVYLVSPSGSLNGPIWTRTLHNGLNSPQLELFKQLRREVEEAYPR